MRAEINNHNKGGLNKMDEQKEIATDSWADFAGEYLKADLIPVFPVVFVPKDVIGLRDEVKKKNRLLLVIEFMRKTWKIELNKTNQNFIRSCKITSPKKLIGKKLTFDKIKVRNPTTNAMVDGLIITKIE